MKYCLIFSLLAATASAALTDMGELKDCSGTLASGVYTVSEDTTFSATVAGRPGLTLEYGADVIFYFKNGATLTVAGKTGTGQNGSGAGILLPDDAKLTLAGTGTLNATGADAVSGSSGNDGSAPVVSNLKAGTGGGGGAGGGGAGAAIGTIGGQGGAEGNLSAAASVVSYVTEAKSGYADQRGEPLNGFGNDMSKSGDQGRDADAAGKLAVYGSGMKVVLKPGAAGTTGADGSNDTSTGTWVDSVCGAVTYTAYGGHGGRGGKGGVAAQAFGSGGGGGGAGASGAGGYITFVDRKEGVESSGTQGDTDVNTYADAGANGSAGTAGSYYTYGNPSVTVTGGGTVASQAATAGVPGCYTVTFDITDSSLRSGPEAQTVVYGQAYSTIGAWYSKYGTQVENWHGKDGAVYYDQDGKPTTNAWVYAGNITLYPEVQGPTSDTGITVNGTRIDTSKSETISGTGWSYDISSRVLNLTTESLVYALSGTNYFGQVAVSVHADCTVSLTNCYLAADEDATLRGVLSIQPGATATLIASGTNNVLDASLASGMNAIYCPTGAELVVKGPNPLLTYTASGNMATNLGAYAYCSTANCLVAKSQDETVIGGNAKAIPYSGYMSFSNCVLNVSATDSDVRGFGTAGSETNKLSRPITFCRGIGILGGLSVYPRPHDEYGMPLYYYNGSGSDIGGWFPAGSQTLNGSMLKVTHQGEAE